MKRLYFLGLISFTLTLFFFINSILPPIATAQTASSRAATKKLPSPSPTLPVISPVPFDYTVTPNVFDLTTAPGSTLNEEIKVYNKATAPNILKIKLMRIDPDESTGSLHLLDFPASDPSQHWITFKSTTVLTPPQQWTSIPMQISIPKDAAYGYYWAIVLTDSNNANAAKTGASVIGSISIPVLVVAQKGGISYKAAFTSFTTDQSFYEYPPVTFRMQFANQGNIHIQPAGNIFIKDWRGKLVGTLDTNPNGSTVLPGGTRIYTNTWDDSFITNENKIANGQIVRDSNGLPETTPVIHFDKLLDMRIGKYTATAIMVVSTDQRDVPYQLTTSFFIFPWKIIVGIVLVVLLVLLGFTFSLRSVFRGIRGVASHKK